MTELWKQCIQQAGVFGFAEMWHRPWTDISGAQKACIKLFGWASLPMFLLGGPLISVLIGVVVLAPFIVMAWLLAAVILHRRIPLIHSRSVIFLILVIICVAYFAYNSVFDRIVDECNQLRQVVKYYEPKVEELLDLQLAKWKRQ